MASKKGSDAKQGPLKASGPQGHHFEPAQRRTDWGSSKHTPKGGSRVVRGNIETSERRSWK